MQLFAGELTNQNQECYKMNDNRCYLISLYKQCDIDGWKCMDCIIGYVIVVLVCFLCLRCVYNGVNWSGFVYGKGR